jgi:hypothetical protein
MKPNEKEKTRQFDMESIDDSHNKKDATGASGRLHFTREQQKLLTLRLHFKSRGAEFGQRAVLTGWLAGDAGGPADFRKNEGHQDTKSSDAFVEAYDSP